MSGDITSANSSFTISVPDVFGVAQTLEGYATEDAFSQNEVTIGSVVKGVDGISSSAFIPFLIEQTVTFQADSDSITDTMEPWWTQQVANQSVYKASGVLAIPSIGKKYELVAGRLTRITPAPAAGKTLKAMAYQITWDGFVPSPL
jgi:hypothetical protein